MRRFTRLLVVALAMLSCPLLSAQAAIYQKVPGTAVYVSAPDGFELTNAFSGFVNQTTGATILIATLPPANPGMQEIFTDDKKFSAEMALQHYAISGQSHAKTRDGYLLTIYQGKQTSGTDIFDKWSTMVFAPDAAYVVTIQAPEKAQLSNDEAMKILRSLSLSQNNLPSDQLDALPFTFNVEPPFQFVGSIMNSSAMLTVPDYNRDDVKRPDIILTKGLEIVRDEPLEKIVDTYLLSLKGTVDNVENRQLVATKFAGHSAVRMEATARMKGEAVDLIIYAALDDAGRPIFLHATGLKGALAGYKPQIEKIAASVTLRNNTDTAQ
ncbi:hypothetical protein [Bartonella sp. LJL80]